MRAICLIHHSFFGLLYIMKRAAHLLEQAQPQSRFDRLVEESSHPVDIEESDPWKELLLFISETLYQIFIEHKCI